MIFESRLARRFTCAAVLLAGFLLSLPGPSVAGPWIERTSDLPSDPAIVERTLPNGVRLLIRHNEDPKGRVSLRLLVGVGSLHERDDERGLAHFLEHMIFRGTVKHPGDSLAQILQREGLGFGPDHTAFTNFEHTIYHLELPKNDEAALRLALSVFFEYSNQAVIDGAALETERGVVLSEKAMRDTPELRYAQSNFEFLWPSSLPARRQVIGSDQVIQSAPRERVAAFYDAWYRPERLALLIVGDIDPDLAARCATEIFGPMTARGPARPEPEEISPAAASEPSVHISTDPAMVGASIHFQHPKKVGVVADTRTDRLRRLQRDLAFAVFQRRLQQTARERADSFVSPNTGITTNFPGWETAGISASSGMMLWPRLLETTEQELRRALEHGFQPGEIEPVKKYFLESLDADVRAAKTRTSESLIGQMVGRLLNGYPLATPETVRDEWSEAIVATTPEDCLREFRSAWGEQTPHVTLLGTSSLQVTEAEISKALEKSRAVAVTPRPDRPAPEFAYQSFGPAGQLVQERHEADLDVRLAEFANGVRLNFKSTRFSEDYVQIVARLPGGRLSLKSSQAGLDWFGAWAFIAGGLKRHDPSELSDILAGRSVSLNFSVGSDSFYLHARCAKRDLLLTLKLMTAHLTDPGWRPEAIPVSRASYGGMFSNLLATPSAPIRVFAEKILFDDKRYGIPSEEEYYRHNLKDLSQWLGPKLKDGAIEISIVGDTNWSDASTAVARTLGALPKRNAWPKKTPKVPRFIKASNQPITFTVSSSLKQTSLAWVFPATDLDTVYQERRARLLAEALEERVRIRLRQELGSAYAPEASLIQDEGLPGLDYFVIYAEVDQHRTAEALAVLRDELEKLPQRGFSEDEFERSKAPFLNARADDVRKNDYWLHTVLADVQQRPERLAAARDRTRDSASIRRDEIEAILRRTIQRPKGFLFISEPAPGHSWQEK